MMQKNTTGISCVLYGLECLFRFYSYGLEKKFRPEIFKDFQEETKKDYESGQLYGLEKFWAYLKYSQSKTLTIDPKLQEYLCNFKRLEDFRVDPPLSEVSGRKRPSISISEESSRHRRQPTYSSKTLIAAEPPDANQLQIPVYFHDGNTAQESIDKLSQNRAATRSTEGDISEK